MQDSNNVRLKQRFFFVNDSIVRTIVAIDAENLDSARAMLSQGAFTEVSQAFLSKDISPYWGLLNNREGFESESIVSNLPSEQDAISVVNAIRLMGGDVSLADVEPEEGELTTLLVAKIIELATVDGVIADKQKIVNAIMALIGFDDINLEDFL